MAQELIKNPVAIEEESFRIIDQEIGKHSFSEQEWPVARRIIHATADFEFVKNTLFHKDAVACGISALKKGCDVVVDVGMAQAGISKGKLVKLGGKVHCFISDEDVAKEAKELGLTRAILSMRKASRLCPSAIVAIGNAPTALLELCDLIRQKKYMPSLVIGVPVGFVQAAESKEEILKLDVPAIVCRGRKGGTPVAVAAVNALLTLALA